MHHVLTSREEGFVGRLHLLENEIVPMCYEYLENSPITSGGA